jgi:ABC-type uncharacterized transport system YnjBCD substrate-binding protein
MRTRGGASFWWTSLPMVFILQALVMWVIATPLHTALTLPANGPGSGFLLSSGIVLFCVGLTIETIADQDRDTWAPGWPSGTAVRYDDGREMQLIPHSAEELAEFQLQETRGLAVTSAAEGKYRTWLISLNLVLAFAIGAAYLWKRSRSN